MFTALKSTGNPGAAEIGVSACFALGDVTADSAPKGKRGSVQLMPAGEFSARDGRGPFMSGDLASMQAIIERTLAYHQATDIVIDYEHQTMLAEDNGLPAPAAGWIKALKATDAGIMAEVEWTERAAAAIRADEYRHISPVFTHAKDDAGEVGLILNAALTNAPALDMAVVAARAATLLSPSQTETFLMKKELLEALGLDAKADEKAALGAATALTTALGAVREALALDDDAAPDAVGEAVAALKSNHDTILEDLGVDMNAGAEAASKAVQLAVTALKAKSKTTAAPNPSEYVPFDAHKALKEEFDALKAQVNDGAAEAAVDDAIKARKISPGQRDWAVGLFKSDRNAFDDFVGSAPVLLTSQTVAAGKPGAAVKGAAQLDAHEIAICRQMGVSPEDFAKSKQQLESQAVSAL